MVDVKRTKVGFSTSEIAYGYLHKQIPDNIVYTYSFGLRKHKILYVHEITHTVVTFDMETKVVDMHLSGDSGKFFLNPQAAVNFRIECINQQIERLQNELQQIKKTYHV